MPWILASLARNYPGITVRQHLTIQKRVGVLGERCAGLKKGLLLYCCNQVCMKNGGRIPWSVTAICETFRISCLMGRLRFGVQFKGPIIPFGAMVEYLPISAKGLSCRDCINSARKSYQEHSSDLFCTRGESGKET